MTLQIHLFHSRYSLIFNNNTKKNICSVLIYVLIYYERNMVDPWQTRKIGHYFRKKICKKERHFFLYFSIYFSFVRKFSFNGWKGIRFKHLLCYIVCKVDEESDREIVRIAIKGMQFSLANSQTKFVHDYRTTYAFVKRTNTTRQLLFFTFYCSFYEPYCHSRPFYDVVFSFNNEKLRKNFILFA